MGVLYLVALGIALFGMVMLDRRFTLFFWRDPARAFVTLLVGVVFFVIWDLVGIDLGIFFRGETSFMTGVQLAPELPLEEIFFLTLLCYLTMNLLEGGRQIVARRLEVRRPGVEAGTPSEGGSAS
ncbi:lycopene cyclase domain-containing protein [Frigoribacterium sp. 2-23]|uniref:lycopene cyclase domain-containing protein n=1 Tax=Frigoribacterium sp. 2-23 TaxID=3415006 RepID=UPI003C6ED5F7